MIFFYVLRDLKRSDSRILKAKGLYCIPAPHEQLLLNFYDDTVPSSGSSVFRMSENDKDRAYRKTKNIRQFSKQVRLTGTTPFHF